MNNAFEWQVGNMTRFIKFEDITDITTVEDGHAFYVNCGGTNHIVPVSEYDRFMEELKIWRDN